VGEGVRYAVLTGVRMRRVCDSVCCAVHRGCVASPSRNHPRAAPAAALHRLPAWTGRLWSAL